MSFKLGSEKKFNYKVHYDKEKGRFKLESDRFQTN